MKGRVALVTGGGRGIGREAALLLVGGGSARHGCVAQRDRTGRRWARIRRG